MSGPRTCRVCQVTYPAPVAEVFFGSTGHKTRHVYKSSWRSRTCIACEQTQRDKRKAENRWYRKASDAFLRHGRDFVRKGIITATNELQTIYGWSVQKLAHDFEHAYKNGCPYCGEKFAEMGHGLADITLDIIDPKQKPFYSNTRPVCRTCNTAKSDLTLEAWGFRKHGWRLWAERKPWQQLPLWEGRDG